MRRAFSTGLTHVSSKGVPRMVDVGGKAVTRREACAVSVLELPDAVAKVFTEKGGLSAKGPVLATAIVAGTQAAKQTSNLIPFCHPLPLEKVSFEMVFQSENQLRVECTVACSHRTGVEMEALTGCSVAALCVYDMCKALSHDIVIRETRLLSKSGGKSDFSHIEE